MNRERWTAGLGLAGALLASLSVWALVSAEAPPGRFTVDEGQGTVQDEVTGLLWRRELTGPVFDWHNAQDHCFLLDGGVGWRLPSPIELASLVDEESSDPAIDSVAFPDTPSVGVWTRQQYIGDEDFFYWYVEFETGGLYVRPAEDSATYVRCVR